MKKIFFIGLAIFVLIVVSAVSAQPPAGKAGKAKGQKRGPVTSLVKYDTNRDGKVSRQEQISHFDLLDGDGDGILRTGEMPLPHGKDGTDPGDLHGISVGFINSYDKDNDRLVTKKEFIKHFDNLDANGDGFLVESEMTYHD